MKDNLTYTEHILIAIDKILLFTKDMLISDFEKNEMVQDAVIRNFEIIGEATKKVSKDFKRRNPEIPWRAMAGMRDKLIHDYLGVDTAVLWKTIQTDIPTLKNLLENIISELE
jgi:uncharacterized protein with HEPN domain